MRLRLPALPLVPRALLDRERRRRETWEDIAKREGERAERSQSRAAAVSAELGPLYQLAARAVSRAEYDPVGDQYVAVIRVSPSTARELGLEVPGR